MRRTHAPACQQGHHHLRDHRLDPHADHVGRAADHARPDRHAGDRCRQGRRRDPASARARSEGRSAVARSGDVHAVPAAHQAGLRRRHQHHHRRQRDHDGGGAHRGGDRAVAGNVLAQHGLDELRALPDGASATRTGNTTGRSPICSSPTTTSSATRFATSSASTSCWARATASSSSTNATTPATSTISRTASTAACSSRRCSCS